MSYFVCALPRSKTAWLSVFLSQSGKYCFHEGLNGCHTIDDYKEKIGSYGDSGTGIHLFDVNKLYPDSPIVVIEKNKAELEECFDWCKHEFGADKPVMKEQYDKLMAVSGMRIRQSDIFNNLELMFDYLTGCEWFDYYRNLVNLNIQADLSTIDSNAARILMNDAI